VARLEPAPRFPACEEPAGQPARESLNPISWALKTSDWVLLKPEIFPVFTRASPDSHGRLFSVGVSCGSPRAARRKRGQARRHRPSPARPAWWRGSLAERGKKKRKNNKNQQKKPQNTKKSRPLGTRVWSTNGAGAILSCRVPSASCFSEETSCFLAFMWTDLF